MTFTLNEAAAKAIGFGIGSFSAEVAGQTCGLPKGVGLLVHFIGSGVSNVVTPLTEAAAPYLTPLANTALWVLGIGTVAYGTAAILKNAGLQNVTPGKILGTQLVTGMVALVTALGVVALLAVSVGR